MPKMPKRRESGEAKTSLQLHPPRFAAAAEARSLALPRKTLLSYSHSLLSPDASPFRRATYSLITLLIAMWSHCINQTDEKINASGTIFQSTISTAQHHADLSWWRWRCLFCYITSLSCALWARGLTSTLLRPLYQENHISHNMPPLVMSAMLLL